MQLPKGEKYLVDPSSYIDSIFDVHIVSVTTNNFKCLVHTVTYIIRVLQTYSKKNSDEHYSKPEVSSRSYTWRTLLERNRPVVVCEGFFLKKINSKEIGPISCFSVSRYVWVFLTGDCCQLDGRWWDTKVTILSGTAAGNQIWGNCHDVQFYKEKNDNVSEYFPANILQDFKRQLLSNFTRKLLKIWKGVGYLVFISLRNLLCIWYQSLFNQNLSECIFNDSFYCFILNETYYFNVFRFLESLLTIYLQVCCRSLCYFCITRYMPLINV